MKPIPLVCQTILAVVALLFVSFAGLSENLSAQESESANELPLEVAALLEEHDRFLQRKVDDLKRTYLAGLEKLRSDWAAANQLDDALMALKMKEQLEEGATFNLSESERGALRSELSRVVDAWETTTSGFENEANALLTTGLRDMRVTGIKTGNLGLVEAVDHQLNRIRATEDSDEMKQDSKEDESKSLPVYWDWASGGTLKLIRGGTAIHSRWDAEGSWKWTQRGERMELHHPGGQISEIVFNSDLSVGQVTAGKGGRTTITPRLEDSE